MNRNFKLFVLFSVLAVIMLLLAARLPSLLDMFDNYPTLPVIPFVLIGLGWLIFLRKARRTGEMPKRILGQFLYASIFEIFWRRRKDGDTEKK